MGAQFLGDLNKGFQNFAAYEQAGRGDSRALQAMQKQEQDAKLGEDLVNQIALGDNPHTWPEGVSPLIPQSHLALLQGVQGQGPEQVRAMANFLGINKPGEGNEELKAILPKMIQNAYLKKDIDENERDAYTAQLKKDPNQVLSSLRTIKNAALSQTKQSIDAARTGLQDEITTLQSSPKAVKEGQEQDVVLKMQGLPEDVIAKIDPSDKKSYPKTFSAAEAEIAANIRDTAASSGLKVQHGAWEKIQNAIPYNVLGSPAPLASTSQIMAAGAPPASTLDAIKAKRQEKIDLAKQKEQLQFRGSSPKRTKSPPPPKQMVRIQASDGSLHDIPRANVDAAKKQDPGLKVLNGGK